ncbi:MAG TPA: MerR family transcriptional regulator [Candidatus Omnitrophota bacterium]|nr:MerR family transcriptional regulator [Candidatus Omnitrophota bacterium]
MSAEEGELPLVRRAGKSEAAFRTISEVAEDLDVPQHVLRFWESKFPQVKPLKRGGGRRYYRPEDVALLKRIRDLLYSEGYTIKGVQKLLREGGHKEGAAAGKPDELRLDLGHEDEDDDLPAMDDGEEDGAEDIEDGDEPVDVEPEPDHAVAAILTAPQAASLAPETRAELEAILGELEQLRSLLQPR